MPELPEVEIVRRGLEPAMAGARLTAVALRRPDLRFPLPEGFAARLEGARIERLDRRGKYLVAPLSTGEALIMHLGMSGRFTLGGARPAAAGALYFAAPPDPRHDHVVFELASGRRKTRLTYNDPRRFGFMDLAPASELDASRHFAGMGPEPLGDDFTPAGLSAVLAGRRTPLKSALLDQSVVAGVGNIYASEALFRARLSPRRLAASAVGARAHRLHGAVRAVLVEAIEAGGSTLRDFAGSDGALGYFQHRFAVYDRAGEPCRVCGKTVSRLVQSGRATFYCSACQR